VTEQAAIRAHGWLVDIIDPKRRSYIDRKTGRDVLTNVPGIVPSKMSAAPNARTCQQCHPSGRAGRRSGRASVSSRASDPASRAIITAGILADQLPMPRLRRYGMQQVLQF
jgi:hypothetical protein